MTSCSLRHFDTSLIFTNQSWRSLFLFGNILQIHAMLWRIKVNWINGSFNFNFHIRITYWFSWRNFIHSLTSQKCLNDKSSITVTIGISSCFFTRQNKNILLCMFFDIFFWIECFWLRLDLWLFNLKESGKVKQKESCIYLFYLYIV